MQKEMRPVETFAPHDGHLVGGLQMQQEQLEQLQIRLGLTIPAVWDWEATVHIVTACHILEMPALVAWSVI